MKKATKWKVVRTIWPYEDGYGVVSADRLIIVDTGLSKEQAQSICDQMNMEDV